MEKISRRQILTTAVTSGIATGAVGLGFGADSEPKQDRVVLVTGAARGIGLATALYFAKAGYAVALLDVANPQAYRPSSGFRVANQEEFRDAEQQVRRVTDRVLAITADVRDQAGMKQAVGQIVSTFGRLDVAVANAGFVRWHPLLGGSDEDWSEVLDTNVRGVANTFIAAAPELEKQGGGSLIALASIGGRAGFGGNGAYTASKWAVIGLVKQAAVELGPRNIRVNAVAPGPVDTPMYRSEGQIASMGLKTAAEQDAALNPALPLGDKPALSPEDIAKSIYFLASPEAETISGVSLDVALGFNANYTA